MPIRLDITGGTDVRMSPPIDYYEQVLFPFLRRMGLDVRIDVLGRGFYPKGGGRVITSVLGADRFKTLDLSERGPSEGIGGTCFSQNLPEHVCDRISHAVMSAFVGRDIKVHKERMFGPSPGAGIQLHASFANTILGADALGERGVPSEQVGSSAASALRSEIEGGGTLDVHAADQLLPYFALADGPSYFKVREVSEHFRTQAWLIERFLGTSINVEKSQGADLIEVRP